LRAAALPFANIASNRSRSSSLNVMTYFFITLGPLWSALFSHPQG
jgi:hypothetical protein